MTTIYEPGTDPIQRRFGVTAAWATVFLIVHIPLGLAMRAYPVASTFHALFVLALGLSWAVAGHEERLAAWGGYVAVSDVLWRMTGASIPWEFAKYALVLVFTVSILRSGRLRAPALPFVYIGLLIPSSLLAVWTLGPRLGLNGIRFNLSGPVALAVGVWFFSRMRLSASECAAGLVGLIGPIISVGSIAVSGMYSAETVEFRSGSNLAASGGYGPNQVSAILGLGVMVSLLLLMMVRGRVWLSAVLISIMFGLASQSALTFSRGGLYTAAAGAVAAMPFLLRERGARRRLVISGPIILAVSVFVVIPRLVAFTGGAVQTRFEDTGVTGRDVIMKADLTIWGENPVLGVGPGLGLASRLTVLGVAPAAHTEWTRLLAEHGLLGFGAAICLVAMGLRPVASARSPLEKAVAAAFVVWAFFYMFHAGMRLAAPSFAVGLAQCRIGGSAGQPKKWRK